mmetsp:Transcript_21594/g.39154  ORF Transcript_21594/g.39154 Transcript_21594/m.39154 type:complete len:93 (-) Transcript_21594:43-321(-)
MGWCFIENDKDNLTNRFLECSKHYTDIDEKASQGEDTERLVVKTRNNARYSVEIKARREKKTDRGGKSHVGISLRGGLQGTKVGCKIDDDQQ